MLLAIGIGIAAVVIILVLILIDLALRKAARIEGAIDEREPRL